MTLIKERIALPQKLDMETAQILLEGDIIVPDIKPDVAVILQTDSKAIIDKAEITGDRVNLTGRLGITVLYLARGSEKPVHSIMLNAPINDFFNIEGLTKDMFVKTQAEITNIDFKITNDRKISYRAVIEIKISCESSENYCEIVTGIENIPANQLQKRGLSINKVVEHKEHQFIVKDDVSVAIGKPNIREILSCSIVVTNRDAKLSAGKVTLSGELIVTVLYKSDADESLIEFLEQEIPFNGLVEIHEAKEDMLCDLSLTVLEQYVQVKPNSDGEERLIEVEVSVGALISLSQQVDLEILEDAYCINKKLTISKTPVRYPRLICRNKNQCQIKEVVGLESNCPDILQIFRVQGTAYADETKIIDDKVVVSGIIDTNVLYIAQSDDTPLYSFRTVIPYRQVIETKGATPDMNIEMDIAIDHVGFNMLSGRELEVRFLLCFNTHIIEERETNAITEIEFRDMEKSEIENMPSLTVYVVQKNDTLWKIAKSYNTCIDELLAINEMESPENIYQGQKLLILKKILSA